MLSSIYKLVKTSPCITFEEKYQAYVMMMQDKIIEAEASFLFHHQFLTPEVIGGIIDNYHKELSKC